MPKRTTSGSIHSLEPPSDLKRTRSHSVSKQTCSLPNGASGKKGAGKPAQRERGSATKGISRAKEKVFAAPEVQPSSPNGNGRIHKYFGNGGAQEAYHASSSTQKAIHPLTTGCAKLSISSKESAESAIIPHCKDEEMSPPGTDDEVTDDPDGAEIPEVVQDDLGGVEPLLVELMDDIIGRLPMLKVLELRPYLGSACRNAIHRPGFRRNRPNSEGEFSPTYFTTDAEGDLHWHGFDTKLRKWTRLPSLNFAPKILPSPDKDLFKDYLMAGDGGLLCVNVGKATDREKLVICNPLTRSAKVLPPLIHARHPVLMHLKVDHDSGHYQVIVAGSATSGTEDLSVKTEVYDSRTGVWECPEGSDLPCPPFGLNEYQNGAYIKDGNRELLMCVAIVDTQGRGVLVYDITKKKWAQGPHVKQLRIPLVRSAAPNMSHLATTQIVECGGSVFVFTEQECGRDVYFVIHKLIPEVSGDFTWDEVMKRKRTGGRGLLVYPEFTCVPVSEHELGIFNTVEHTLEIIDLVSPTEVTPLQYTSGFADGIIRFHSLNPISFVFKPSFKSVVSPRGQCKAQCKKAPVPEQVPQNQKLVEFNIDETEPPTEEDSLLDDVLNDDDPDDHSKSEEEPEADVVHTNPEVFNPGSTPVQIPDRNDATEVSSSRSAGSTPVQISGRRRSLNCGTESGTPPQSKSWEGYYLVDTK